MMKMALLAFLYGVLLAPPAGAAAVTATADPVLVADSGSDADAARPERPRRGHGPRERPDHDRARAALQAGEILPLPAILERVRHEFLGEVLEVELEARHGLWLYKVRLLTPDGQVLRLDYDAGTTDLVAAHGRNLTRAIRPDRPPFQPPPAVEREGGPDGGR